MNRIGLASIAIFAVTATPAMGQTLSERIATVRQQRAEAQRQAHTPTASDSTRTFLQVLFQKRMTVRFDKTPAREAFDFMKTALNVNMIVRYSDDPVGYGIDPTTPITLEAKGMHVVTILDLMLEQVSTVDDATWQLRDGYIEIGTKERLAVPAAQVTRIYPIDDILYEPPSFVDAPIVGIDWFSPGPGWGGSWGGGYGGWGGVGFASTLGGRPAAGMSGGLSVGPQGYSQTTADLDKRAQSLIDLIIDVVEPEAWIQNGGDWASVQFREGGLVVRAPDFVQRQIGGYPAVPRK